MPEFEYTIPIGVRGQGMGPALGSVPEPHRFSRIGSPGPGLVRISTPDEIATETPGTPVEVGSYRRAFPGGGPILPAQGYGATALSGADRSAVQVFPVTTTADSGPGSFRQALLDCQMANQDALKIITFRTGGYIGVDSMIDTPNESIGNTFRNVYIAGQTAPGGGVTLRLGSFSGSNMWRWHRDVRDVVIRGLRLRLGGSGATAFLLYRGLRVLFDHLSFSWAPRRNLIWSRNAIGRSGPIMWGTTQRCVFAESMNGGHIGNVQWGTNNPEPYDTQVAENSADYKYHTLLGNVFGWSDRRNPNIRSTFYTEVLNNVMYNYHHDALWCGVSDILDYVGNWCKKGPYNRGSAHVPVGIRSGGIVDGHQYRPSMYVAQNVALGGPAGPDQITDAGADNWSNSAVANNRSGAQGIVDWHSSGSNQANGDASPLSLLDFRRTVRMHEIEAQGSLGAMHDGPATFPAHILDPYTAQALTVGDAGAGACVQINSAGEWVVGRQDSVDQRYRDEIAAGTGISSMITSPSQVGGFPTLASGSPPADSNEDGVPDAFYQSIGANPFASGLAGTIAWGGYCLAEHYVNGTNPETGAIRLAGGG